MNDNNPEDATLAVKGGKCPMCGKPVQLAYRPFCSTHCANLDLSRWLNGVYAVPVTAEDEDDFDEFADPNPQPR